MITDDEGRLLHWLETSAVEPGWSTMTSCIHKDQFRAAQWMLTTGHVDPNVRVPAHAYPGASISLLHVVFRHRTGRPAMPWVRMLLAAGARFDARPYMCSVLWEAMWSRTVDKKEAIVTMYRLGARLQPGEEAKDTPYNRADASCQPWWRDVLAQHALHCRATLAVFTACRARLGRDLARQVVRERNAAFWQQINPSP